MATIRDVARHAGVSAATVSRVLNNHPSVNETTRYAVLQSARELNYAVENLRSASSISRSVLVLSRPSTLQQDFERHVWDGVHTVLETHGIATRLQQSLLTPDEAQRYASDISVSGLILLGGAMDKGFVRELLNLQVPFVMAGAHLHPLRVNVVMAEVAEGIRQAVQHLIARGRRRIGFVNGPHTTTTTQEKLDGLRLSLHLNDLPFIPHHVTNAEFNADSGFQQTLQLLEQANDLDAIIFADDSITVGGIRAIKTTGRSIPGDLAVIGFGNYDIVRFTDPPVTSVDFDKRQMGVIAAKRLTMLLDEYDEDGWLVRVPTRLVIRESA